MKARKEVCPVVDVRVQDIHYGGLTARPTTAEVKHEVQQGLTPWINEMKRIDPALEVSECEPFLRWIAKHEDYRFPECVADQITLAERIGVPSVKQNKKEHKAKGKSRGLNTDQENALTVLWLWQYNDHLTKATICEVINRHMSTRRPYAHSVLYDKYMMETIVRVIVVDLNRLEEVERKKILQYLRQ